ncbi:MAG: hypothetical protein CBE11_03630 [Rickettsiales bacterium TMED251]|jgi:hypothetical protein|nr:MAG: hypothetical protein CBE11_03630 [Rickettsiales bacterium TMED251]|tara:strand:- start:4613 stop:4987 length:375 start_codon:yes stop_codon:yes gene_type:complete
MNSVFLKFIASSLILFILFFIKTANSSQYRTLSETDVPLSECWYVLENGNINAKLSSASSQNNNFTHYIFFKSSIYRIEINWKRIPTIFCEKITYFEDVKENWQSYSQDTGEWIFLDDEKGKNK